MKQYDNYNFLFILTSDSRLAKDLHVTQVPNGHELNDVLAHESLSRTYLSSIWYLDTH